MTGNMASADYDIITVGGGLAGSALAKGMAEHGARVLVLEREAEFRDRVRGEAIMPWGVPDLRALGLYDTVMNAGGHPLTFWDGYQDGSRSGHRNLERTTPSREPVLACFHPNLQEAALQAAIDAGAVVRRGARLGARLVDISGNVQVAGTANPSPVVIPLIYRHSFEDGNPHRHRSLQRPHGENIRPVGGRSRRQDFPSTNLGRVPSQP